MIWADNNMGVIIMQRDAYIKQCIHEHLGNKQVYKNITDNYHEKCKTSTQNILARFGATAKVHKTPVKLRPSVAKIGTSIESVSKWLDHQLQKLMTHLPWCIKDSDSFRHELEQMYTGPVIRPLVQAILKGLELVMRHNIMKFGNSYFLQLTRTAMGTSVAVVFANLYFGWHEKETLLPKYCDILKNSFPCKIHR
eukprot:CCRYP_015389-RA/>CCRYP_015389-RA protein AED:0.19 eAED:0.19 QI:0/0/0/1/0/0/3/0/194